MTSNRGPAKGTGEESMTAEERLARLERQTRRWNLILTVAVIGLCGYIGFREFTVTGIIRARELKIIGDHGRTIVHMTRDQEGDGQIDTFSAKEEKMVSISTSPTGGMFNLYNQMGNAIVSVQSNKLSSGSVSVRNVDGHTQEAMTGSPSQPRTQLSGSLPFYR
ncbi:MAG: hypothetical protein KDA36_03890 [Planctomycetaceae bacterium]|nr:hypothetical protein [Planctomycetaceae bacterium]